MKAIKKRTVENVIKGGKIHLEDILIGDKKFSLDVINDVSKSHNDGSLILAFNDGNDGDDAEYTMRIEDDGVSFERKVYSNHDHPNYESLQVKVDDKLKFDKFNDYGEPIDDDGEPISRKILWSVDPTYSGFGYELYRVPFGSVKVDY